MATRQSAGKSGKRATASAAGKPGNAATSLAKPGRSRTTSEAAKTNATSSAKSGSATKSASPAKSGRNPAPSTDRVQDTSLVRRWLRPVGTGLGAVVRWSGGGVAFTTMIVSLLGLADAVYLTYQHFSEATSFAGCSDKGGINCLAVTTSPESHLLGIPVSVLGLGFFLFMVAVNSRWGWRSPYAIVHWARLVSVIVGIVFVLYLIWAELFRINAICLYCTGVHILTFILFAVIVSRASFAGVKATSSTN